MAAAILKFGRYTTSDSALGRLVSGAQRGSIMGSTAYNAWSIGFGARAGKAYSSDPTAYIQWAKYTAVKSSGTVPTPNRLGALVGISAGTVAVTALMVNGAGGTALAGKPAAPIRHLANQAYGITLRCDGGGLNFGQDASGLLMHKRNADWDFSDPFAANTNDPEGKMTLWEELIQNTKPKLPSNVSPAENGVTTLQNPVVAADFRDDEEVLPGFTLGQGDKVGAYRVRILTEDGTAVLRDSGKMAATGTMQTDRRITWTVSGAALAGGTYRAEVTHYDLFDTPSDAKTWTFSVNTSKVSSSLAAANIVDADPLTTNDTAVNLTATWDHLSGTAMTDWRVQIAEQGVTAPVRGPIEEPLALASGATFTTSTLFSGPGWAPLTPGRTYRFEVSGKDADGVWSPYAGSAWWHVNASPLGALAITASPANAGLDPPALSARLVDPDNDSQTLTAQFFVRPVGGAWTTVPNPAWLGAGQWGVTVPGALMPVVGPYEWMVRAADPYGLIGPDSPTQSWTLLLPIQVTGITPANDSTITTGTPTISASADRTVSSWRLVLREAAGLSVIDTGMVGTGTISYSVPAATLRNGTTYIQTLTVNTTDGLTTTVTTYWMLAYVPRPALTGMSATPSPGRFEPAVGQYSEITVSWDALPLTEVAGQPWADDFGGYVVERLDVGSGLVQPLAILDTRSQTTYVDRTPASGMNAEYRVSYLYVENDLEWLKSAKATDTELVQLENTVISDMGIAGYSVPLRFWRGRDVEPQRQIEIVEAWDGSALGFQGPGGYDVITGDFELLDDEYGTFAARDLIDALRDLSLPVRLESGRYVPRVLAYRDPKGRLKHVVMSRPPKESDDHAANRGRVSVGFTEVSATGYAISNPAYIDHDDAVYDDAVYAGDE